VSGLSLSTLLLGSRLTTHRLPTCSLSTIGEQ
jgi:hypothetical protein